MSGRDVTEYDLSEEDPVARALMRVANMQQPFYASLLHQMKSIEIRLGEHGAIITDVKEDVAVIVSQQLLQKIDDHDKRLDGLEKAETLRQGMAIAANVAPKVLVALCIIVAMVLAYLKLPNPIPPH